MTNCKKFYHSPEKCAPIGLSRHCSVLWRPKESISIIPLPNKAVKYRPITTVGIEKLGKILQREQWLDVKGASSVNQMDIILHRTVFSFIYDCFPEEKKFFITAASLG